MASEAELRFWRRLLLLRERDPETGLYRCQASGALCRVWEVQAHHIYPKSIYPGRALDLSNGAVVLTALHQGAVHGNNASRDVGEGGGHWREWVAFFGRQSRQAARRRFAAEAQPRLDAYAGRGLPPA